MACFVVAILSSLQCGFAPDRGLACANFIVAQRLRSDVRFPASMRGPEPIQ
jgi:hypothetical protein